MTIDDAPDKHAVEMAKTLKELEVPAIFFVNGHFLDSEEEKKKLKTIHELGFTIGNHTQTHANLKDSTEEQQRNEILEAYEKTNRSHEEILRFLLSTVGENSES